MKNVLFICVCLCVSAFEAHAGNKGYAVGDPPGQLSAEAESVHVGPQTAQKPQEKDADRLPTLKEALHTRFNMMTIKKMDDWVKENFW